MGNWRAVGTVVAGAIGAAEDGDEGVEDEVDCEGFVEEEGMRGDWYAQKVYL